MCKISCWHTDCHEKGRNILNLLEYKPKNNHYLAYKLIGKIHFPLIKCDFVNFFEFSLH